MPNNFAPPRNWETAMYSANSSPISTTPAYMVPFNPMIMVEGEVGAKAWQMPTNLAPNTIIPLWDTDGEHVYFRSVDAYGRPNPMKTGRIVMDKEPAKDEIPEYITRQDLDSFKKEILNEVKQRFNQNGNKRGNPT